MLVFWDKFPAANKVLPLTSLLTFILGWLKSSFWQENTNELSAYPVFSCFQKWETNALKKKKILFRYYPQFFSRVKVKEFSVLLSSL